ncbi:unnamed protein product [Musa acuminata subsp. burmannicoides]
MFDMELCPEMLGLSADIFPRIMDQLPARAGRLRERACDETLRGRGGGDAAHHQRQVRRSLHRGAQPAHPRPRRRLPGTRHQARPLQA